MTGIILFVGQCPECGGYQVHEAMRHRNVGDVGTPYLVDPVHIHAPQQVWVYPVSEVDNRLNKLYDALETGEFKSGDLAPRIQALLRKKEELHQAKADAEEALRCQVADMADPKVVQQYVEELRGLLDGSSITEQRGFLKSFVERIEVGDSEIKAHYTVPMPPVPPRRHWGLYLSHTTVRREGHRG